MPGKGRRCPAAAQSLEHEPEIDGGRFSKDRRLPRGSNAMELRGKTVVTGLRLSASGMVIREISKPRRTDLRPCSPYMAPGVRVMALLRRSKFELNMASNPV